MACLACVRECSPDVGISLLISKLEEAGILFDDQGIVRGVDLIPAEDKTADAKGEAPEISQLTEQLSTCVYFQRLARHRRHRRGDAGAEVRGGPARLT